jgi:hypothetical protein
MTRVAMIALVLLVVFSITYALISPDCGDDIDGVLRPNRLIKAQPSAGGSLPQFQTPAIVWLFFNTLPRFIHPLIMSELLDLGCTRRC